MKDAVVVKTAVVSAFSPARPTTAQVDTDRADTRREIALLKDEMERRLQMIVHDLRNPLTGIVGFAELLQTHPGRKPDAQSRLYLDAIIASAEKVSRVLNTTLAESRARQESALNPPCSSGATPPPPKHGPKMRGLSGASPKGEMDQIFVT